MKPDTTANRLREYMRIYQMKQADIVAAAQPYCTKEGVKINKSDISQYLSGKASPGSDKIYVLSVALGLNPAWLLGYNVPMYKTDEQEKFKLDNCHSKEENEKLTQLDEQKNQYVEELKSASLDELKMLSDFLAIMRARSGEPEPHDR